MIIHRFLLLVLSVVLLIPAIGDAQISQGGKPMKTLFLKSSRSKTVEMPPINHFMTGEEEQNSMSSEPLLKSFQFAYPFEVNLTPENSGEWLQGEKGYSVWKLTIRSAGAKSLNLIFDEFDLPKSARLFIYNETENHILGAFTSVNNKTSGKFAVSPVLGEEITVQYEIPESEIQYKPFRIININHDYVGILKAGGRRPLGKTAGSCNIDINCDDWDDWGEVKNSVCRLIVNGVEVCSGILVNNTAENQKPYILSAAHCYDRKEYAETTVYTFNYESPFCAPLDGDPSNSISGATMKAKHDSLDFSLVELSLTPPPEFRPYYAGWDHSDNLPTSTVSITHPQGDIKKIATDKDPPVIASFENVYTKNGFLKILRWDEGVTEPGSSGGPLYNINKQVIGTLTGGSAVCGNPTNDYFNRFSLSWDYRADTAKQLKYWLDPLKSGVQTLAGKQFNEGENLCAAFTNLTDIDDYEVITLLSSNKFAGYWGGSNSVGITEIMERFSIDGNEELSGISLGVGKLKQVVKSSESEITLKVYNGDEFPEQLIHSQIVKTADLVGDAMNFVGFSATVRPNDSFFVGFELSNIQPLDSFVVYQSMRTPAVENTFYFMQNGVWRDYKNSNSAKNSMANIFELVACNINDFSTDTQLVDNPHDILIYPNPSNAKITVEAGQDMPVNKLAVFNLLGQKSNVIIERINDRKVKIDLTGNVPGVYFVRFDTDREIISQKISFVPW